MRIGGWALFAGSWTVKEARRWARASLSINLVTYGEGGLRSRARKALRSPGVWLATVAAIGYCLVGLMRQKYMLTAACDLGIFDQAVHGWATRGVPEVPIKGPGFHHWGDHFMPLFALFAPLYWIHDSPQTLLVAGHVLLASSGIPVHRAIRRLLGDRPAVYLTAAYLLSFGMLNAVGYDVHETAFTTPLLAWALERALAGRWTAASGLVCATMLAKEDLGATVFMFGIVALIHRKWRHGLVLLLVGPTVMLITVYMIMPHFAGGTYSHYDYLGLGDSQTLGEFARYALTHPVTTVITLFDHSTKLTTWGLLLVPFGLVALRSPLVLLVLPTLAERMLSAKPAMWTWTLYYDTPLMPILVIGMADAVARARRHRSDSAPTRKPPVGLVTARWPELTLATVLALSVATPLWQWLGGGLTRPASYRYAVKEAIQQVPPDAQVQVSNFVLPQLPRNRSTTLIGSRKERGDWAIIDLNSRNCGGRRPESESLIQLRAQGFDGVYEQSGIIVLHRG